MTHRMVLVSCLFYHRPLTLEQFVERRRCFGLSLFLLMNGGVLQREGKQDDRVRCWCVLLPRSKLWILFDMQEVCWSRILYCSRGSRT